MGKKALECGAMALTVTDYLCKHFHWHRKAEISVCHSSDVEPIMFYLMVQQKYEGTVQNTELLHTYSFRRTEKEENFLVLFSLQSEIILTGHTSHMFAHLVHRY